MVPIEIAKCPSCGNKHSYPFDERRTASSTIFVRRVKLSPSQKRDVKTSHSKKYTRLFTCPQTGYMFQSLIKVMSDKATEVETFPISPLNAVLFESAKKQLTDSIDVARKFSQFMVTLSAALIPAYLALLKFVGIDEETVSVTLKIICTVPPFLFLGSCTLFIIACFPRTGEYSLEVPGEIESERDDIIQKRRRWIYFAATLFLLGILGSIITISIGLNT